jgi:putative salt-induced outer membrane protein YdiY
VILHDILGRIEIPRAAIQPTAPKPEVVPVSPWSGKFDLALSGSEGNTDTSTFRAQLDVKHDDADSVDAFTSWFRRTSTDNDSNEEKAFAQLRHEWKLQGSKWSPFVQGSLERDIFAGWDARLAVAGGGSYQIADGPVHKVAGRLGAGVSRKFNIDDDDVEATTYEALLGLDWAWKISELSNFTLNSDLYPSISETGEYRAVTRLAYETRMDPASAWFLKIGLDDTYDSQPGDDKNAHDVNYYVGMGRTF